MSHAFASSFGGDTNQAGQFARSVPDFVLKGRFADQVKLDLQALEQEMDFAVERPRLSAGLGTSMPCLPIIRWDLAYWGSAPEDTLPPGTAGKLGL
jgi:hypothetical protein